MGILDSSRDRAKHHPLYTSAATAVCLPEVRLVSSTARSSSWRRFAGRCTAASFATASAERKRIDFFRHGGKTRA